MENELEKIIRMMKKSGMTAGEKARMKRDLSSLMESGARIEPHMVSPYQKHFGVPSYFRFSFSWQTVRKAGKIGAVSALSLLFVLGGLTYASANALPGDLLYPIKINLKEGIEDKLTFAPSQKIALLQKRIDQRFTEVEQLIKENKITPEKLSIADSEIQVEKEQINSNIQTVNEGNPQAAEQAQQQVDSSITSRQEKITSQIESNQDINSIQGNLSNFNANLSQEYQSANQLLDNSASGSNAGAGQSASGTESLPGAEDTSASGTISLEGGSSASGTDSGISSDNGSSSNTDTGINDTSASGTDANASSGSVTGTPGPAN